LNLEACVSSTVDNMLRSSFADLKVRKLGAMASRPPSPGRNPAWGT